MSSRTFPNLDDKPYKSTKRNRIPHGDCHVDPNIDHHPCTNSVSG